MESSWTMPPFDGAFAVTKFLRVVTAVTNRLHVVLGQETLVRDTLNKGSIDRGTYRPRTFDRIHIIIASF
jgi:hypothetical protein